MWHVLELICLEYIRSKLLWGLRCVFDRYVDKEFHSMRDRSSTPIQLRLRTFRSGLQGSSLPQH
jgi:hypothetical protein